MMKYIIIKGHVNAKHTLNTNLHRHRKIEMLLDKQYTKLWVMIHAARTDKLVNAEYLLYDRISLLRLMDYCKVFTKKELVSNTNDRAHWKSPKN